MFDRILTCIRAHGIQSTTIKLFNSLGRSHGIHLSRDKSVLSLNPILFKPLTRRTKLQKMHKLLCRGCTSLNPCLNSVVGHRSELVLPTLRSCCRSTTSFVSLWISSTSANHSFNSLRTSSARLSSEKVSPKSPAGEFLR